MTAELVDLFADHGLAANPSYIADFDRCQPAEAISKHREPWHWTTMPFSTDDFSGVMLAAGPESVAPQITYPLDLQGWHAISFGIHPTSHTESDIAQFLVKLTTDKAFSILTWQLPSGHLSLGQQRSDAPRTDGHYKRTILEEIYWKTADLTDQQIVFRQLAIRIGPGDRLGAIRCGPIRIAYIKLVPLSDREVERLEADRDDVDNRRVYAFNDIGGMLQDYRPTTAEEICRHIEPYRDSDFSRIYWEMGGGDVMSYPTDIAHTMGDLAAPDYPRTYDRLNIESWNSLREQGIDQYQVALEYAHEIGLEFHACYRAGAWTYPTVMFGRRHGFYRAHAELQCVSKDGGSIPRISYAHRETQDFVLSLFREVVTKYDVDGVCMMYNRRPPYLCYEAPLVEGFREAHGEDPRELADDDPRWLQFRAAALTDFMRRLRAEVDAAASNAGRDNRLNITAFVLGREADNFLYGMDVATWAEEGLIDTLVPYSPAPLAMPTASDTWSDPSEIEPFVAAVRDTPCRLAVNLMPYHMSPAQYRRMAAMLYQAGSEDLFCWSSGSGPNIHSPRVGRANYWPSWTALRRLGHYDEIRSWIDAGEPSLEPPVIPLRTLDDWNMAYVAPG